MTINKFTDAQINTLAERIASHALNETNKSTKNHLFKFQDPAFGPVLSIKTKEDLVGHIVETLKSPETKGFFSFTDETNIFIYNDKTKSSMMVGPAGTDGGTIFRAPDGEGWFLERAKKYERNFGAKPNVIEQGGLHALIEDFEVRHGRPPDIAKILETPVVMKPGFEAPKPASPELAEIVAEAAEAGPTGTKGTVNSFEELVAKGDIAVDAAEAGKFSKLVQGTEKVLGTTLKVGGKVIKVVPLVGTLVGLGMNSAEAAELDGKLRTAMADGKISKDALTAYDSILTLHAAQGADPSAVLGEGPVQLAFNEWADQYYVEGDLRESLRPSSLALMVAGGVRVVKDAAVDVGGFALEKAGDGFAALGHGIAGMADNIKDRFTGQDRAMKEAFEILPMIGTEDWENDAHLSPTDVDRALVFKNPSALALAEIKSQIVMTQDQIEDLKAGRAEPLGRMSVKESVAFLSERDERLQDRFEASYEELQAHEMLPELNQFLAEEKERIETRKAFEALQGPQGSNIAPLALQQTSEQDITHPYYMRPSTPGMMH